MTWTNSDDVIEQLTKWWLNGSILASLVLESPFFPKRLRLRGPSSSDLLDRFNEVRPWIAELRMVPGLRIEFREFRHRTFGKNQLPSEIWLDSQDEALSLIGKTDDFKIFSTLCELTRVRQPELLPWLTQKPMRALDVASDWSKILNAVSWVLEHDRSRLYLRQVDMFGVDTKFFERNAQILSECLDLVSSSATVDEKASGASNFARRYGFRDKPDRIRFRLLDPDEKSLVLSSGVKHSIPDLELDVDSMNALAHSAKTVFITENEINFLSFERLQGSLVIFGGGYAISRLEAIEWLKDCKIIYWGDIDTHGFAILNRLRQRFAHVKSILMDEETLLRHASLWGTEPKTHESKELQYLLPAEQTVFVRLKANYYGANIRLEQERIGWNYAWSRILDVLS